MMWYNSCMSNAYEEDEEILLTLRKIEPNQGVLAQAGSEEDSDTSDDQAVEVGEQGEENAEGDPEEEEVEEAELENLRNLRPTIQPEDVVGGLLPEDREVSESKEDEDPLLDEPYDGQLAVDVIDTSDEILVLSTIAGVRLQDIDVSINHDMVTIKGTRRKNTEVSEDQYLYQECYWGGFSRSIILPEDVDAEHASATLEQGILTIRLPKTHKTRIKRLSIEEKE